MNRFAFPPFKSAPFKSALFTSVLLAAGPTLAATQSEDASLRFVAKDTPLVGVSFGLSAVDGHLLLLEQRTRTHFASGRRTVDYTCPNEPNVAGGSRMSFDFVPGQQYELVCRSGQPALIRPADEC